MREIKVKAFVEIDDEHIFEIEDDWTDEDIWSEVNFFILERLQVTWEFV